MIRTGDSFGAMTLLYCWLLAASCQTEALVPAATRSPPVPPSGPAAAVTDLGGEEGPPPSPPGPPTADGINVGSTFEELAAIPRPRLCAVFLSEGWWAECEHEGEGIVYTFTNVPGGTWATGAAAEQQLKGLRISSIDRDVVVKVPVEPVVRTLCDPSLPSAVSVKYELPTEAPVARPTIELAVWEGLEPEQWTSLEPCAMPRADGMSGYTLNVVSTISDAGNGLLWVVVDRVSDGGAHPSHGRTSFYLDRASGRRLSTEELLGAGGIPALDRHVATSLAASADPSCAELFTSVAEQGDIEFTRRWLAVTFTHDDFPAGCAPISVRLSTPQLAELAYTGARFR